MPTDRRSSRKKNVDPVPTQLPPREEQARDAPPAPYFPPPPDDLHHPAVVAALRSFRRFANQDENQRLTRPDVGYHESYGAAGVELLEKLDLITGAYSGGHGYRLTPAGRAWRSVLANEKAHAFRLFLFGPVYAFAVRVNDASSPGVDEPDGWWLQNLAQYVQALHTAIPGIEEPPPS